MTKRPLLLEYASYIYLLKLHIKFGTAEQFDETEGTFFF